MKDEELLNTLKIEMLLAEARARGAEEAYKCEAIRQARRVLGETHGIMPLDKVEVHFTNGDFVFEYRELSWGWSEKEPVLMGRRILKNGKPSKNKLNEAICGISYMNNVRKQITKPGLPKNQPDKLGTK